MKRNRGKKSNKITKNKKINKVIIIGIVVAISLVIGFALTIIKYPSNANAAAPIDRISCGAMEASKFHIHSQLNIFINGKPFVIPSEIGITNTCLYWLHTHDDTILFFCT